MVHRLGGKVQVSLSESNLKFPHPSPYMANVADMSLKSPAASGGSFVPAGAGRARGVRRHVPDLFLSNVKDNRNMAEKQDI